MKNTLSILSFILLANSLLFAQNANPAFEEKYNVNNQIKLKAQTFEGNIKVLAGTDKAVKILIYVSKSQKQIKVDKADFEKHFNLKATQSKDIIDISTSIKDDEKKKYWTDDIQVSMDIYVPNGTSCDLYTTKGNLEITNVNADHKCITSDGEIDIKSVTGALNLESSNGNINFKKIKGSICAFAQSGNIQGNALSCKDSIIFNSANGMINVVLPDNLAWDVFLKGKVVNTSLEGLDGTKQKGFAKGRIRGGGMKLEAMAPNGNVSIFFNR
jgi:hypothetical protein